MVFAQRPFLSPIFHSKWANSIWNVGSPDQYPFHCLSATSWPYSYLFPHHLPVFPGLSLRRARVFFFPSPWPGSSLCSLSAVAPRASFSCWDEPRRLQGWTELKRLLAGGAHFQPRPFCSSSSLSALRAAEEEKASLKWWRVALSVPHTFTFFFPRVEPVRHWPRPPWRFPWLHNSSPRPRRGLVPSPLPAPYHFAPDV